MPAVNQLDDIIEAEMDLVKLLKILKNEPSYRLQQAKKAVFADLITDWSKVTSLPLSLRLKLARECPLTLKARIQTSSDQQTVKTLITLKDNLAVESVLMRHQDGRRTVCVSCQVGCPLGCRFCATGKLGFRRNLESDEIIAQVLFFGRYLKNQPTPEKVSNIVFMGMGEPFLNFENVIYAIRTLNDKNGFNLGIRHFSISTAGIIPGIKKLAREKLEVNLAISLHAPFDQLRSQLMPINRKYPLKQVLVAVDKYIRETNRKVMFEYLLIKDVNDSQECAFKLAQLMKKRLYLVNLISYNPTGDFAASPNNRIKKFKEILENQGVKVTQRWRFGGKIKAACGQLAAEN